MVLAVVFAEVVSHEVSIPFPDGLLCVNTALLLVVIALLLVLLFRRQ